MTPEVAHRSVHYGQWCRHPTYQSFYPDETGIL